MTRICFESGSVNWKWILVIHELNLMLFDVSDAVMVEADCGISLV